MLPKVYTIGVYDSTAEEFFGKLTKNKIDTFCDIRRRRAVRGSQYTFVNSVRLQKKLAAMDIHYLHELELAPTTEIMELQHEADEESHTARRKRTELSKPFIQAYEQQVLKDYDWPALLEKFDALGSRKVVFFCVEKDPEACHRSLVTEQLKKLHPSLQITHL